MLCLHSLRINYPVTGDTVASHSYTDKASTSHVIYSIHAVVHFHGNAPVQLD